MKSMVFRVHIKYFSQDKKIFDLFNAYGIGITLVNTLETLSY